MGSYGEAVKNDSEIEYENKILYIVESILMLVFVSQFTEKNIYLLDDVWETLSRIQVTLYTIINSGWIKAQLQKIKL